MFRFPSRSIAMALGFAFLASGALAADTKAPEKPPAPTQEQRAKMAAMHRQMADCLDSDKSFDECHAQMQAACAQAGMMGYGCGGGMMGGGGRMMRGAPPAPKQ